ncbi:DUF2637 domain-containing protein [Antrihabitans spumae]|uniref:DUF2637 domain-containing protein n=2 Tax=Antrihabitans spumae TaxID=3373370 RepID=A0ABW7KT52_9NOCA
MRRINAENVSLAMTLVIAAGAFVWSFAVVNELAAMAGQHRALAWIGPVLVDGAIIQATVAVAVASSGVGCPRRIRDSRVLLV